ncbi:MAG: tyrosine-type recombinase/integrase [Burkholderiaceae bacterium]
MSTPNDGRLQLSGVSTLAKLLCGARKSIRQRSSTRSISTLTTCAKSVRPHGHDLRHEAASRLFEAGLSIEQVALVTGHKDWRMLKRYTNLRPRTCTLDWERRMQRRGGKRGRHRAVAGY